VLGEEHPDTAASCNNVAFCLDRQGQHGNALPLYQKALEIRRKVLGEEHPDTASSYNNLASCLNAQGQHGKALPLLEKALLIRRQVLGEEHPDTAASCNNVAFCLNDQGQHGKALPLFEKALRINRRVLGEEHPDTATSYNNVASCLEAQGQHGNALLLYQRALEIRRMRLGEKHPATAASYDNVAFCLNNQGRHTLALPLSEKALEIRRQELGEEHPDTARSYNNVASCLNDQGQHSLALPLYEKALLISRRVLGEEHLHTAHSYNNVAFCLDAQGQHGKALPLFEKALMLYRKVLGEEHPYTATSYNNLAFCLNAQGQHGKALPLFEKALVIFRKVPGEEHPYTARCYDNVAFCLNALRRYDEALPRYEKALAIRRKVLGEGQPDTAKSYNNVASCLDDQGKHDKALSLYEKGLLLSRKVLGEEHPDTATSYNNVATCLNNRGQHGKALSLLEKALLIRCRVLGEEHPDTVASYGNVASCLWKLDRLPEAVRLLQASVPAQEAARIQGSESGFDRAITSASLVSPRVVLALGLSRLGQPRNAFAQAEASLARALLDDLDPATTAATATIRGQLRRLDDKLLPLFGRPGLTPEQQALRDELARQRREVLVRLVRQAATHSERQLLTVGEVQKQIPAEAALVLWLDFDDLGEHRACIVRSRGAPQWLTLRGSGAGGAWMKADRALPGRLYRLLSDPSAGSDRERNNLIAALREQRLGPLRPHLAGVKQLFVVPTGWLASIPLEALTAPYRIRYVPSGSVLARTRGQHRGLQGTSLLALGDPLFQRRSRPRPPEHGVMLAVVQGGGKAHRAGLRAGDVLLQVGKRRLNDLDDLKAALGQLPAQVRYWRDGQEGDVRLADPPLGILLDRRPVADALRAHWRLAESVVSRGPDPAPLPGTRAEVQALARLVPGATALLGSQASEQRLHELARSGKLASFRLIHLATHGHVDLDDPRGSALLLGRDQLPDLLNLGPGQTQYTGELTVAKIREQWSLDADLVVLSACQTALGRDGQGDGLLGFAHAFLSRGARSVVLSRWKVDDTATALLMLRFYENLLDKKPLGRAAALAEARAWLRKLSRQEAEGLAVRLKAGKLTGTRRVGKAVDLPALPEKAKLPTGERPYEHPYYWSAFTLIGDHD
jgi:tetratricopeptide (TPR) repeat protein